jgi:uncharacterized protein with PIN domain
VIAVDASAVLAILLGEPEGEQFVNIIESRGGVMTPVNYWEVLARSFSYAGAPRP